MHLGFFQNTHRNSRVRSTTVLGLQAMATTMRGIGWRLLLALVLVLIGIKWWQAEKSKSLERIESTHANVSKMESEGADGPLLVDQVCSAVDGTCDSSTEPVKPPNEGKEGCVDTHQKCEDWATMGECEANPKCTYCTTDDMRTLAHLG